MTEQLIQPVANNIRNDPEIIRLLERMPDSVRESFNDEQLMHIRNAVGVRKWGNHSIDFRGVLTIPMCRWRYYYVLLIGKNRRLLSAKERLLAIRAGGAVMSCVTIFSILFALLVLYLLKSAAGIDLFPGFSLGIWDWFENNLL